jgi:ribosomal protein S18 acetylase RimI-like enzyme
MDAKLQRKKEYDRVSSQTQLGQQGEKNTWYLEFLAVRPEYQRMGIGKALVRYVIDMVSAFKVPADIEADQNGTRCYLHTSQREPNVAIYEGLSFKVGASEKLNIEGVELEIS